MKRRTTCPVRTDRRLYLTDCSKNQNSQAAEKMVRCKKAKKTRARSHAQKEVWFFSLTQQIAVLGQPASR
jgi:hypothetical protein